MARLSQKELLDEGFASALGAIAKKGAQAVGAVGSALNKGADMGIDATWGGVAKAGAEGWEKTGDMLTGQKKKLEKFLDDQGLMVTPKEYPDPKNPEEKITRKTPGESKIVGKIAIVDAIQYDFDNEGKKMPMAGAIDEKRKFRYKDNRWEVLREKRRGGGDSYGVDLDEEDISEAKQNPDHPLAGKLIKHQTKKGDIIHGTLIGVVDEYAAIDPHESSPAPGIYGVDINAIAESTEDEAAQSAPKTQQAPAAASAPKLVAASFSQKDQLRQLHMLQG